MASVIRSRLTYKKIIADQAAEIASQRGKIQRLTKQVARLQKKIASVSSFDKRSALDEQAEL